jgi:hypothetical protein
VKAAAPKPNGEGGPTAASYGSASQLYCFSAEIDLMSCWKIEKKATALPPCDALGALTIDFVVPKCNAPGA